MPNAPRKIPTPREINEQQKRDAERATAAKTPAATPAAKAPASPPTSTVPATTPAPSFDEEAAERHLAGWAGPGGRLYAFNGSAGYHRLLDDGTEMPAGQLFLAYLRDYARSFIRFNEDGPPTLVTVRLGEAAELPTRESLGDNEPKKWPISELTGQPADPWQLQATFPIVTADDASELYLYVARGVVALNAVDGLLGRWRHHPKRKQGLVPIVQINNSTYYSKKFGCDRPKPEFRITGWVAEDDAPPQAHAQIAPPANDMDDTIPF